MVIQAADFEDAFHKGLGRAWLYLESSQDREKVVRAALEQGCVEVFSYDPQCEGSRSEWIYKLLLLTSNAEHYEEYILEHLSKIEETRALDQALDLLSYFWRDGSERAKSALYSWFEKSEDNEAWLGGTQIIRAGGLKGYLSDQKEDQDLPRKQTRKERREGFSFTIEQVFEEVELGEKEPFGFARYGVLATEEEIEDRLSSKIRLEYRHDVAQLGKC
jgi:hypothetical protein